MLLKNITYLQENNMKNIVLNILYKYKALDIKILNMKSNYILSNYIIIALGSSSKHVQSIFENTVKELKVNGLYKNTICCGKNTDWIVIDINDIIVHIMTKNVKLYYKIEDLFEIYENKNI